jgi:hypothetical protein
MKLREKQMMKNLIYVVSLFSDLVQRFSRFTLRLVLFKTSFTSCEKNVVGKNEKKFSSTNNGKYDKIKITS